VKIWYWNIAEILYCKCWLGFLCFRWWI